jgi:two-component system OmpR family response regulator
VKVLVVEDAASVRARMVALLAEVPGVAAVFAAENLAEAVTEFRSLGPQVVVLDLHLHGESGLVFVPLARQERPAVVIIVVTNLPSEQHRRQSLALGADHFFDKSCEFDELLGVVARAAAPTATAGASPGAGPTRRLPRSDA